MRSWCRLLRLLKPPDENSVALRKRRKYTIGSIMGPALFLLRSGMALEEDYTEQTSSRQDDKNGCFPQQCSERTSKDDEDAGAHAEKAFLASEFELWLCKAERDQCRHPHRRGHDSLEYGLYGRHVLDLHKASGEQAGNRSAWKKQAYERTEDSPCSAEPFAN